MADQVGQGPAAASGLTAAGPAVYYRSGQAMHKPGTPRRRTPVPATPPARLATPPAAPPPAAARRSADPLAALLGEEVVLDTAGPIVYLGRLAAVLPTGFWLEDADVHDRADGHATKELYLREARALGIRAARLRVFVVRDAVISVSRLADIIVD